MGSQDSRHLSIFSELGCDIIPKVFVIIIFNPEPYLIIVRGFDKPATQATIRVLIFLCVIGQVAQLEQLDLLVLLALQDDPTIKKLVLLSQLLIDQINAENAVICLTVKLALAKMLANFLLRVLFVNPSGDRRGYVKELYLVLELDTGKAILLRKDDTFVHTHLLFIGKVQ